MRAKKKPKLVTRRCKCACGKTWKTTARSKSKYFSLFHDPTKVMAFDKVVKKRGRPKKGDSPKLIRMFYEFDRTIDDDEESS